MPASPLPLMRIRVPSFDPCRDLHRIAPGLPFATGSAACRAGILDHSAVAATARARLGEREEPLALGRDSTAAALRADLRRGSGLRARAGAVAAGGLDLDGDLGLDPLQRVLEGEVDLNLEVGAALGARALLRRSPPAAEDPAEEVTEVGCVEVALEIEATAAARVEALAPGRRAELVVGLALLRIREDVVGRLDLLEALFGRRVARILVRVVLAGELAVRLLDLVSRGSLGDAEGGVQILGRRRHAYPSWAGAFGAEITTRAGLKTRSPSR